MAKFNISLGPIRITFRASFSVAGGSQPGRRWTRRRRLATVLAAFAVFGGVSAAIGVLLISAVGSGHGANAAGTGSAFSPTVVRTRRPPTGYTVTFRYRDPSAKSVQLEGEWYFSSPAWYVSSASHPTPATSQGLLPGKWKPGDFPLGWPDTGLTTAGWPVVDMKKDSATGVWSDTIPLPSGDFDYGFLVNCPSAVGRDSLVTQCPELSDPSNPPWNDRDGVTVGSVEPTSQVYVPSDPAFDTVNYSWQAPTSPRGALRDVSYPQSSASPELPGFNRLAIYTPPGYDFHRATRYPTVYLNGGFGSNEVDWSTRADAANILDNLIDRRAIKPMVVVMTEFNFSDCLADDQTTYDQDLIGSVIPYVQAHYDVSRKTAQRAFAGLSCGGGLAGSLLLDHTSEFGYVGVMSPFPAVGPLSAAQARAIKRVGVLLGGGYQDPIHANALEDVASFRRAGVNALIDFVNGGHDWHVWRILLRDFLTRVAFKPAAG